MSDPIILYDIPSQSAQSAWSPNTWNARFALNIKGLNYRTEWLEYPEIEPLCLKIGAKHTSLKPDGRPHYTCPVLFDPSTGAVISDSPNIALYLDRQYPSTPRLFPEGTKGLIAAYRTIFFDIMLIPVLKLTILDLWKNLNKESQPYFRDTREARFGIKLEEFAPKGDGEEETKIREKRWKEVQDGLDKVASWLDANVEQGKGLYLVGDRVSYPDIMIAGILIWVNRVAGGDFEDWKRIIGLNDGRWEKFFKNFEQYTKVI